MTTRWASIFVAGGVALGVSVPATAADLGGNCCADLEERIAEMEATVARKGNRKVSLTIYGKVNEAVMFWDDGHEQNAYVVTNDASRTRFGVKGGAKISDDLSANYKIEVGIRSANSKRSNQFDAQLGGQAFDIRHLWWNLKSKTLGTIQVGHTPVASQEITEMNLAGTNDVGKFPDVEDSGGGFFLVRQGQKAAANGLQWRRLIARTGEAPGEGDRRQAVYYISPEFAGFSVGAAWGGDDSWDAGVRYEGEFGKVKIKAGIAYQENMSSVDGDNFRPCPAENTIPGASDADCDGLGGSVSILDTHHGLYANLAAGQIWDNAAKLEPNFAGTNVDDTYWFWATEAGIQQKWNHLGKTTLFGQYYQYQGGGITQTVNASDPINSFGANADIYSSQVDVWGLGAMQKIDAAEMKLYTLYRHYEFDLDLAVAGVVQQSNPLEAYDVIMTGAVIKF